MLLNWLKWGAPVALAGAGLAVYCFVDPATRFVDQAIALAADGEIEALREWIGQYGAWGPLAIILLMLLQTLIPVIPSILPMVLSVVLYGQVAGAALAFAGALLAAGLGYAIGRLVGPAVVQKFVSRSNRQRIDAAVDRFGVGAVFVARVIPLLSTDAVSIVAGSLSMRFLKFAGATAAGTLLLVALVGYFGEDSDSLTRGMWVLTGVTAIAFAGYLAYKWRKG